MAKSKLFEKIHILMNGRKFGVYEPTFTFDIKPSRDSCFYAEVHMDAIMDGGVVAEFMNSCNYGLKPVTVIADEIPPDTISLSDWERIRLNEDVFVTTDVLRKALKEYFDRILSVNGEE